MKSKLKTVAVLVVVAAVFLTGIMVYAKAHPEAIYIVKNYFAEESVSQPQVLADSTIPTVKTSIDELKKDNRVSFDQSLMLINTSFNLSSDFKPEIVDYLQSGVYFNSCFCDAYTALKAAVLENTGDNLYVMSSYRSREEQQQVAESEGDTAAELDCSEHQAGLAADVYVMYYAGMGFIESEAGEFVNSHCGDYGFIIRYPYYGKDKTGIEYEPWHIRFVGLPHSQIISQNKLTLEEYIDSLKIGSEYICGNYFVSRQTVSDYYNLPCEYTSAVISPDNTGNVIITAKIK